MSAEVDLLVHHGNEAHATGHHLVKALRSRGVRLVEVGAGHKDPLGAWPADVPLLWIESGRASFPHPRDLEGRPCAAWLIDTHRGLEWRAPLATAFDHCFVAQVDAVGPVSDLQPETTWLPLAAFDPFGGTEWSERAHPVSFVGFVRAGTRRAEILDRVGADFDLRINTSYVAPDQIPEWYRSAQVVINVPLERDLNMRFFEAAAAGAIVVTGPMHGLDEIAPPGAVVVVDSDDPEDWSIAVGRSLGQPPQDVAALQRIVAEQHTYDQRAAVIEATLAGLTAGDHETEHRHRVLIDAAVRRHAVKQAWSIADGPRRRSGHFAGALLSEVGRSAKRRLRPSAARS